MTGISTLHAASLLRRHDLKLDSHGAMGTLGNLKFAAAGGRRRPGARTFSTRSGYAWVR
ncbi:hypothetical protein WJ974_13865 [Achromobacter xylosoxidans]